VYGRKTISLEELLWRFRHSRGLFFLGAGASAGIVPFGLRFMATPPDEAKALQRPLPDGALEIVATGEKDDPRGP
jgi:hypothetical protein